MRKVADENVIVAAHLTLESPAVAQVVGAAAMSAVVKAASTAGVAVESAADLQACTVGEVAACAVEQPAYTVARVVQVVAVDIVIEQVGQADATAIVELSVAQAANAVASAEQAACIVAAIRQAVAPAVGLQAAGLAATVAGTVGEAVEGDVVRATSLCWGDRASDSVGQGPVPNLLQQIVQEHLTGLSCRLL